MEKKTQQPTCSRCKVSMVKRFGRRGEFWGCPNYPACKFTRNVDGVKGKASQRIRNTYDPFLR